MYELSFLSIGLLAGMAIGCMIMAVLHRRAEARKEQKWRAELQAAEAVKRPPARVVSLPQRKMRRGVERSDIR
jgi:hypothetical protein